MEKKDNIKFQLHRNCYTDEALAIALTLDIDGEKGRKDFFIVYKDGTIQCGESNFDYDGIHPSWREELTSERREIKLDADGYYAEEKLPSLYYYWALGRMAYHDIRLNKIKEAIRKKIGAADEQ